MGDALLSGRDIPQDQAAGVDRLVEADRLVRTL